MSVKDKLHQWIDRMPEDSPGLRELYQQARLDEAITEAKQDLAEGRVYTWEQIAERRDEKCRQPRSA